jgi:hypothetical protein
MKIEAQDLRKVVDDILDEYSEEVSEAVGTAVTKTANEAVKELKQGKGGFNNHVYSKGWTKKITKHRLYSEATVYNKSHGHLTHLLEFGHAKRNGGRTRAFPHIAPINDKVPEMFVDNFTDALADQLINNT